MLNANLILIGIVILILLKNHIVNNKGIIYAIIAVSCFQIRLMSEAFPISAFEHYPFILRLVLINGLLGFLVGPSALLYITGVFGNFNKMKSIILLLYVPFFLFLINFIPYWNLSLSDKILLFENSTSILDDKSFFLIPWRYFMTISEYYNSFLGGIVIIYIFRHLIHNTNLVNKRAFNSIFFLGFVVFLNWMARLLFFLPKYFNWDKLITSDMGEIISLGLPISIILIPSYFNENLNKSDLKFYLRLVNNFSKNGNKSESSDDAIINEATKILNYLHQDKAYLSPGFSKHDIVTRLNIPQKTVTDCFSKVIKIPFPKLRNQLRIEYATELFRNNAHLNKTISGIAIDSGFQNRASFYIAFKEVTNVTPVEWIKENCEFELVEELEVANGEGSKSTMSTQIRERRVEI